MSFPTATRPSSPAIADRMANGSRLSNWKITPPTGAAASFWFSGGLFDRGPHLRSTTRRASPGNGIAIGPPGHQAILHPAGPCQRTGQPQPRRQQHHRDHQPGDRGAAGVAWVGGGDRAQGPGYGCWNISGPPWRLIPPTLNQIINRAISLLGYFGGFPARRDVHTTAARNAGPCPARAGEPTTSQRKKAVRPFNERIQGT